MIGFICFHMYLQTPLVFHNATACGNLVWLLAVLQQHEGV